MFITDEEALFDVKIAGSTINSGNVMLKQKVFVKVKDGKAVGNKCKKICKKSKNSQQEVCSIGDKGYVDGLEPASVVYSSTCCACVFDSDNVFARKIFMNNDNLLQIKPQTFEWLSSNTNS